MMLAGREEVPSCFGKLWEAKAKECVGGLDPAFTDEKTGSHIRDKCDFFDACGGRTQAASRQLIDPKSLIRSESQVQKAQAPIAIADSLEKFAAAFNARHQNNAPSSTSQMLKSPPAPSLMTGASQVPMNYQAMMPVNYQMPAYLTVPEEYQPGDSFWTLVGRTVLRSFIKGAGHSIANLADSVPLSLFRKGRSSPP